MHSGDCVVDGDDLCDYHKHDALVDDTSPRHAGAERPVRSLCSLSPAAGSRDYGCDNDRSSCDESASCSSDPHSAISTRITRTEINSACSRLRLRCAAGIDSIESMMILDGGEPVRLSLVVLFNASWATAQLSPMWRTQLVKLVPKRRSMRTPSNLRPISVLSIVARLLENIVQARLSALAEHFGWIHNVKFGFAQGALQ